VVSGNHHNGGLSLNMNPLKEIAVEFYRGLGWRGLVVNVTRDDQDIDLFSYDRFKDLIEYVRVILVK
jgi:hypothetical protein